MPSYSVRDVERVLRLSPDTTRNLIRAGFVKPARGARREFRFSFQDLIVLRTARALIDAKIPRQRIHRSLERLRRELPDSMPLSGLSISAVGDHVVVRDGESRRQVDSGQYLLGYPAVSQESYGVEESNQGGVNRLRSFYIPEPTVTQGIVSKLPSGKEKKDEGVLKVKDTLGQMYQLDIFAGAGSSGGPVLNSSGKVIGLLSMGTADAEHVSFAVPVSAVRELLRAQRSPTP